MPLGQGQVRTCRVVAATVQQNHVAGFHVRQIGHHAIKVHATCFRVEITVRHVFDVHVLQDRQVVRPCGIGHENTCIRVRHLDHVERLTHSTRTTRCRRSGNRATLNRVTQNQRHHCIRETRIARQTCVGLRLFRFPKLLFRRFDRTHDRRLAFCVLVNAYAQIDLVVPRIFAVRRHQGEDFVSR